MEADPSGDVPEEELGKTIVVKGEGLVVIYRLSRAARDSLALLDSDPDATQTSEVLSELGDLDEVREDGPALIRLAAEAKRQERSLYCWICM